MAIKATRNEYGDCSYQEDDIIDLIYSDPEFDITQLHTSENTRYNQAIDTLHSELAKMQIPQARDITLEQFDKEHINNWRMPDSYKKLDVTTWLLEKCASDQERERVKEEMVLFEAKGFVSVLKFLIYFVDVLRQKNMVWGVGRGSSVASFCLFLIGVHKINPIKYNLDHREFLR